jgi:glycosyltransferase involved in cell wall biosynthesis
MPEPQPFPKVAVIIPSYRVKKHILQLLDKIGDEVSRIYVVDDLCPEGSGIYVKENCVDQRVRVLFHEQNMGVGGATMTGYKQAIDDGAFVMVKLDGDGQMDPTLLPRFIKPIIDGVADYTKGNRFFYLEGLVQMPGVRLFGNAFLSFMAKFSTGYWDIFDPTNGYTAIHSEVAACLPMNKIERRYFFESDMLFRLNILRAVVLDIPMTASYGDEQSSLLVARAVPEFFCKHLRNSWKRVFYNYYLRDFSIASLEILFGMTTLSFGVCFGAKAWIMSYITGVVASSGTVMLAALPTLVGIQLILTFLSADMGNIPTTPLQKRL